MLQKLADTIYDVMEQILDEGYTFDTRRMTIGGLEAKVYESFKDAVKDGNYASLGGNGAVIRMMIFDIAHFYRML